ncbi:family 1 glycosylhydrolase [Microbacterium sp. NPDC080220]|uniref:family 1 glycosylhydrolase n=1 Tax=Microbacterium sp. NPDC080220 TaxID=3161017 RepID=UPI0034353F51
MPFPDDVERTLTGWEYYPEALGHALRHTHEVTGGIPMIVTENGMATADDSRRIDYTTGALEGVSAALRDGLDVRGDPGRLRLAPLSRSRGDGGFRGPVRADASSGTEISSRTHDRARNPGRSAPCHGCRGAASAQSSSSVFSTVPDASRVTSTI